MLRRSKPPSATFDSAGIFHFNVQKSGNDLFRIKSILISFQLSFCRKQLTTLIVQHHEEEFSAKS